MVAEEGGFDEDWLVRTEPGHATGGGRILDATMNTVTFGFNARTHGGGPHGHCNVIDCAAGVHGKCLDVTAMMVTGTQATCIGNATVNGAPTTYRMVVNDIAEPGRSGDTFSIEAGDYVASGPVTQGNIQVR
jgi:hypothetical protein